MKIILWGTGKQGKRLMKICQQQGWDIYAFTNNDVSSWGSKIDGIPVISPSVLEQEISSDIQIWIAAEAPEIYEQALKIDKKVLPWDVVRFVISGGEKYPNYPQNLLDEKNIKNCRLISTREKMLEYFSNESVCWKMAEIGVAYGDFSEQIISICNPKKLYLVDAWEGDRYEKGLFEVKRRLKSQIEKNIVEIRKGYSTDQLEYFEDEELDWVYIDTIHDYETTCNELELCHRKVKRNGFICGHDYTKYNVYSKMNYGVYDAVNNFMIKYGYELSYLTMEADGLHSFCLTRSVN